MSIPVPVGPEPSIPTPRPFGDLSGGVLVMGVGRGLEFHRLRVHIRPFDYNNPVNNTFSTAGGSSVDVVEDYNYDSPPLTTASGQVTENSVGVTISNLRDLISAFYNNAWTIGAMQLFVAIPDPLYDPVALPVNHRYPTTLVEIPVPNLSVRTVLGVNGTASSSPPAMININVKTPPIITAGVVTQRPGRGRFTLLDSAEWDHSGASYKCVGDFSTGFLIFSGSATPVTEMVGYLGCSPDCPVATSVVAHNGLRFTNEARVSNVMFRRSLRIVERNAMVI